MCLKVELNGSGAPPPKRYKADVVDAFGSGQPPVNNAANDNVILTLTTKPLLYLVGVLDIFCVYM